MNPNLQLLCDQFIQNRDIIKESFAWDSSLIFPACATIFMEKNIIPNRNNLKFCENVLKENTGVLSNFRSNTKLPVISMMSISNDPIGRIQNTLGFYNLLKKYFWNSEYLALGAMILSDMIPIQAHEFVAMKASRIYNSIKKVHPFLTSSEDAVFCLLLAASGKNENEILTHTEECYELLKPHFFSGNAVQALSHALTMQEGTPKDKCDKFMNLYFALNQNGYKYGTSFELASLGLLATIDVDSFELIKNFGDVNNFLKSQKGYGLFGIGEKQRYMHIVMILLRYYGVNDNRVSTATFSNIAMSIIIAQQIALVTMIATTSVATSAGNV